MTMNYQHRKTEYPNISDGVRMPLPTTSRRERKVVSTPMNNVSTVKNIPNPHPV